MDRFTHSDFGNLATVHDVTAVVSCDRARLDQLKDVYSSEVMTQRAMALVSQSEAELCASLERLTQTPTSYIYTNPDYREHRNYRKVNFHAQSVWVNRTSELGLPREPWKWPHWNDSKDFWKSRLSYLARYGFCADASLAMTEENCVLRLFNKIGHKVQTYGFEMSKARGREIVDFYIGRQAELDATTGVAARLDATLELNLEELGLIQSVSKRVENVDWA